MSDLSQDTKVSQSLSLTLAVPATLTANISQGSDLLATANDFVVDCNEMATLAAQQMTACKKFGALMEAGRKDFLEPAQLIIERAKKWFSPPIEAAQAAEAVYKTKLLGWSESERKRIELENQKREELARKLRQEAEARAAAERARAEEVAAQRRRQAAQAEMERRKAEAEGNARLAAAKAAEAAKATEQANAAIETGEANAQTAQLEAAAAGTSTAPVTQQKVAGFSTRKNWVAQINLKLTDNDVKLLIAKAAVGGRTDLLGLLELNMGAANKMAKALESAFTVPGMTAINNPVAAGRN